jgi:hypothetical protein
MWLAGEVQDRNEQGDRRGAIGTCYLLLAAIGGIVPVQAADSLSPFEFAQGRCDAAAQ